MSEDKDKKSEANKKRSLFEIIDQFLFQKVDQFLQSQANQKITDAFANLDPKSQKYANHLLTLIILILPLFVVFNFVSHNRELKAEYQIKQEILSNIHQFRGKKSNTDALYVSLGSPIAISSRQDLQSKMNPRMRNFNLSQNQIIIDDFKFDPVSSELGETIVRFNLKELTMTDLSNFFSLMLNEYKMRSTQIEIELNESSELLGGNVEFVHLKRISSASNE